MFGWFSNPLIYMHNILSYVSNIALPINVNFVTSLRYKHTNKHTFVTSGSGFFIFLLPDMVKVFAE